LVCTGRKYIDHGRAAMKVVSSSHNDNSSRILACDLIY
jgi:hypothetical protein